MEGANNKRSEGRWKQSLTTLEPQTCMRIWLCSQQLTAHPVVKRSPWTCSSTLLLITSYLQTSWSPSCVPFWRATLRVIGEGGEVKAPPPWTHQELYKMNRSRHKESSPPGGTLCSGPLALDLQHQFSLHPALKVSPGGSCQHGYWSASQRPDEGRAAVPQSKLCASLSLAFLLMTHVLLKWLMYFNCVFIFLLFFLPGFHFFSCVT